MCVVPQNGVAGVMDARGAGDATTARQAQSAPTTPEQSVPRAEGPPAECAGAGAWECVRLGSRVLDALSTDERLSPGENQRGVIGAAE